MTNTIKTSPAAGPRQKDLRKGRFSKANHIYHITSTTLYRQPVFKYFKNARRLIEHMKISDQLGATTTLAFVVMPDHIH